MYNLEDNKIKEINTIESVRKILVKDKKKPMEVLVVYDPKIDKPILDAHKIKLKNKSERDYIFKSEYARDYFILECRRLIKLLRGDTIVVD